uniref:peptidylprolyl isomerase n=1 Tax=Kalanchoe fedtschenkoi TaxID=63787 RepID=A0A7N0U333_KALFE
MMEAAPLHAVVGFPRTFRSSRSRNGSRNNAARVSCVSTRKIPKRLFVQFIGLSPLLFGYHPALAASLPEMKEPEAIRTVKLDSGVKFQDIIEGEGVEAHEGDIVEVNYVCRRSNGYFVYSTVDQFNGESRPVILPLDENQTIKGLKEVLVGMKAGGKRRALIPPSVGYVNENLKPVPDEFGPRRSLMSHASEPLVFEVQLLKVLRFQPLLTIN